MKRAVAFVILSIFLISAVSAASAGFTSYQHRANNNVPYSQKDLNTYWPIVGDKDVCEARQDILLQVSPVGCQPAVVRSDLLAEQNVPVFCQIDALEINPLIDIEQIRNIRFTGDLPEQVTGTGFHPARAALKSRDKLLGSPLINNIGYVVVVLKRAENESSLPDSVNVNLTAQIQYDSGNALGVGRAEFILEPIPDHLWEREKVKYSFWQGRYFVRLEQAEPNFAVISIYSGDRRISTVKVEKGETSSTIYVPGFFCRAGVSVAYDGFIAAQDKATIEISDDSGSDVIEVYEGSRFLNDRCVVRSIEINEDGATGNVEVSCSGSGSFANQRLNLEIDSEREYVFVEGDLVLVDGIEGVFLRVNEEGMYVVDIEGVEEVVDKEDVIPVVDVSNAEGDLESVALTEKEWEEQIENYFDEAKNDYEGVADDYPEEVFSENSEKIGERALIEAIELSKDFGKMGTRAGLIKKFLEIYPESEYSDYYERELTQISLYDLSESAGVVEVGNKYYTVILKNIEGVDEEDQASAEFTIANNPERISVGLKEAREMGGGKFVVEDIEVERVTIYGSCDNDEEGGRHRLEIGESATVCGEVVVLRDTNVKEIAKVRLLPVVQGTETETNVTVNIGIEKRAIELSPDKTLERIDNLNESIERWESISDNLGNVVSGLKAACFATSGVLTAKNFLSGLSGESLARQSVMRGEGGWTQRCNELIANGEYSTLTQCFNDKESEINADVEAYQNALSQVNSRIDRIEGPLTEDGFLGIGKSVDTLTARKRYCQELRSTYGSRTIDVGVEENVRVDSFLQCDDERLPSYNDLRELELSLLLNRGGSAGLQTKAQSNLESIYLRDQELESFLAREEERARNQNLGLPSAYRVTAPGERTVPADVVPLNRVSSEVKGLPDNSNQYVMIVDAFGTNKGSLSYEAVVKQIGREGTEFEGFEEGEYAVILEKRDNSKEYTPVGLYKEEGENNYIDVSSRLGDFGTVYGIGRTVVPANADSYNNRYQNPEVQYYETEPYEGLPAVVPFDVRSGWYAATKQTLPGGLGAALTGGSGVGAYQSSGQVTSFYLCNVGPNGLEEFFDGLGDDICQLINLNTGQPLGSFPGLSEDEARRRVGQAVNALHDAANQHGNNLIKVNGQEFSAKVAPVVPDVQCQDFMSPTDCKILFNVCDPVICPTSRCDLGGKYPVADVVQTGIVGSALLCLPNIREGIAIPVCLTGIQAGIDGYVSVLKAHRDCLQENLETGRMIGICDEIYSVYMCEFFWRQVAPVADVILPKLVELAYGQGTRGGGEYLTVMGAWDNMQKSINYFTQSYASNSLEAFQARNIQEAGGEFCKGFVSAKAPADFETLIEPDSPPQFYANFDSIIYSDATVPATSHYKVFYHIFAGKDSGVHYSVYLRNIDSSPYVSIPAIVTVDTGFIPRGEQVDQTRDFTAPEGYKELCVRINNEESCGFSEVTTNFAVNYLRDQYVEDELTNTEITSEDECISGSPNLGGLLNPNIQSGVEDATLPEVYERGVVRICSTSNPGSGTDPTRFVEVGYCDDPKLKCWLDKQSVDEAISDSNVGVRNATLQELEEIQLKQLGDKGYLIEDPSTSVGEIEFVKDRVDALKGVLDNAKSESEIRSREGDLIDLENRIDSLFDRLVYNHHKAQLILERARLNAVYADALRKVKEVGESKSNGIDVKDIQEADVSSEGESESFEEEILEINLIELQRELDLSSNEENYLVINGDSDDERSNLVYIVQGRIYIEKGEGDILIGSVNNDGLIRVSRYDESIGSDFYEYINGAFIEGKTVVSEGAGSSGAGAVKSDEGVS